MLTIGDIFPAFNLKAVVSIEPKDRFYVDRFANRCREVEGVLLRPKDFTFVCPTEIAAFGKLNGEFSDRDTVVLVFRPTASSSIWHGASTTRTCATCRFRCLPTSSAS